jgi:hypothetical protein
MFHPGNKAAIISSFTPLSDKFSTFQVFHSGRPWMISISHSRLSIDREVIDDLIDVFPFISSYVPLTAYGTFMDHSHIGKSMS